MSRTSVTFDSAGVSLAGHYYVPDDDGAAPRPAIVVSHPGQRRERRGRPAGLYAQRAGGQGVRHPRLRRRLPGREAEASPGWDGRTQPSGWRHQGRPSRTSPPATRVDAGSHQRVRHLRGAAGYVLPATAKRSPDQGPAAAVSAVDIARQFPSGGPTGAQDPRVVSRGLLNAAARARTTEAEGKEPTTLEDLPPTPRTRPASWVGSTAPRAFQYYCTPLGLSSALGQVLRPGRASDKMAIFDAFASVAADRPSVPCLLVIGTRAVTSWMGVDAFPTGHRPQGDLLDRRCHPTSACTTRRTRWGPPSKRSPPSSPRTSSPGRAGASPLTNSPDGAPSGSRDRAGARHPRA